MTPQDERVVVPDGADGPDGADRPAAGAQRPPGPPRVLPTAALRQVGYALILTALAFAQSSSQICLLYTSDAADE